MANTLVAADVGGLGAGYYQAAGLGSLTPNTLLGYSVSFLIAGYPNAGEVSVLIESANAVAAFTDTTLLIDGTPYALARTPNYDGTATQIDYTASPAPILAGNTYSIDIGGATPPVPSALPANAVHAQTSTSPALVVVQALPANATQGQTASSPTIAGPAFTGPTWVGLSTANGNAAGFNIDFSASGRAAGDKLYIAVATANQFVTPPTGWTEVATYSPQSRGTAGSTGSIRLTLLEKASAGTETTVAIPDAGDHQYAVGAVVRAASGATLSLDAGAGNNVAATTAVVAGGVTTTVGDTLVLHFIATDRDSAGPSFSGQANANLNNLTERFDAGTTAGSGSGIAIYSGEKPYAGATGNTTITQAASSSYCWITLALKSVSAATPISPDSATQGQSSTSPALSAAAGPVSLNPDGATQAQTATPPAIAALWNIAPADTTQGQSATGPTIAASSSVTAAGATQAQEATEPTIAAASSVSPGNSAQAQTATSPALSMEAPADAVVDMSVIGHIATSPALAAASTIAPVAAFHAVASASPSIAASSVVVPAAAAHAVNSSQPALLVAGAVAVDGSVQGHTAASPALLARSVVAVAGAAHAQTATQPALVAWSAVTPQSSEQQHTATVPGISAASILTPVDALQLVASDQPGIAARASATPHAAFHLVTSTQPTIVPANFHPPVTPEYFASADPELRYADADTDSRVAQASPESRFAVADAEDRTAAADA